MYNKYIVINNSLSMLSNNFLDKKFSQYFKMYMNNIIELSNRLILTI
jgi:hypothetical protein